MKKYILIILAVIILTSVFIMPPLSVRVIQEAEHKGFRAAIDISDFKDGVIPKGYIESGISAVYVRAADDLENASSYGLPLALEVYPDGESYNKLDEMFELYDIDYLVLRESENPGESFDLSEVIEKFKPVLVLKENISQNGNEKPSDFNKYFEISKGRLMRAYETLEKSVVSDESYDAVYYQMLNSAHDRNTEFIIVNQLTDSENYEDNIKRTQRSVKRFADKMTSLGYREGKAPDLSAYFYEPSASVYAAAAAIGCLILLLCLMMLGMAERKLTIAFISLAVCTFFVTYAMPGVIMLLYPTLFAAAASVFLFVSAKKLGEKYPVWLVFIISLMLIAFSGLILSAMLSGLKYYMCLNAFYGVKIALLSAPAAAIVLSLKEYGVSALKEEAKKNKLIVILLMVFLLIYLIRSGNTGILETERIIRNGFTEIFPARPRTKEFLIGWPLFYLYLKSIKKEGKLLLKFIYLIGTAILFSSVINSFCHVFTDTSTMYLRLVNGFVFSLPVILVLHLLKKVWNRVN